MAIEITSLTVWNGPGSEFVPVFQSHTHTHTPTVLCGLATVSGSLSLIYVSAEAAALSLLYMAVPWAQTTLMSLPRTFLLTSLSHSDPINGLKTVKQTRVKKKKKLKTAPGRVSGKVSVLRYDRMQDCSCSVQHTELHNTEWLSDHMYSKRSTVFHLRALISVTLYSIIC